MVPRPLSSTLFPYTTLFRSRPQLNQVSTSEVKETKVETTVDYLPAQKPYHKAYALETTLEVVRTEAMSYFGVADFRSEEHTSELQSRLHLVCRLLLEKKKNR